MSRTGWRPLRAPSLLASARPRASFMYSAGESTPPSAAIGLLQPGADLPEGLQFWYFRCRERDPVLGFDGHDEIEVPNGVPRRNRSGSVVVGQAKSLRSEDRLENGAQFVFHFASNVRMMFESAAQGSVAHGFLDGPRPLFGSYHAPAQPVRDIGYVICPPLGWEGIQSYQTVQRLADALAAAGFHTVRVHVDGTGESLGTDEDPGRVAAW